jgi:hypothetical protein
MFQSQADLQQFIIEGEMLLYCGPLVFLREGKPKPMQADSNGTFGLVDTGSKKLLVTCQHVWDGFETFRQRNPAARMGLLLGTGTPILMPDKPPFASDRDLDLAVFDFEELLPYATHRKFYPVQKFPIERVHPGDIVAFLGYPGEGKQLSEFVGNFEYSSFGFSVTAVGDLAFTIQKGDDRRHLVDNAGRNVSDFELRGISGSPCYRLSRALKPQLVGFVKEGHSTDSSFFVAHASFIQPDGTLQN